MKFSIITPSFNQGEFIQQTIDSVISQTGDFDIEYFVMDAGSKDDTVKILQDTEKKLKNNPRISFYWQSKPDKGQTDAINQGLKKATGDIVAYINSDDYYQPGIFNQVIHLFSTHPTRNWLTGYSHIVDENNQPIQQAITLYKNFWLNIYHHNLLSILNFISQPSTFIRKDIIDKYGPFDINLHLTMDYDYWLKIAHHNPPIILKDYVSNFRIHSNSKGKLTFKKQFKEDLDTARKYISNPLLITLHSVHNFMINSVYFFIK